MENKLFIYAMKNALRYPSENGELTTEQLFQLPLTGRVSLNLSAQEINKRLQSVTVESFVGTPQPNSEANKLKRQLEVVKMVIAEKQSDDESRIARSERAQKRQQLETALAEKDVNSFARKSRKTLEAELSELQEFDD